MSKTNVETIQAVYAAFARGDAPAAFADMSDDMVWNEAESFPYADRNPYIGPAAIGEGVFFRLSTEWNNFQAVPDEFLDAGDTVIALGRYKAAHKATGKPLDAQFAHVWRLNSGKIVAFQQYTDTHQAVHAAQLK